MRNKEEKNNTEVTIYSALGVMIILKFMPIWIPYVICSGGLLVSLYGILDIINKSDSRDEFDIRKYIESSK